MLLNQKFIMMIENYYVPLQLPIPYKNWKLYPLKVKDSVHWLNSFDVINLDQEKNTTCNVDYISATYLEFLRMLSKEEEKNKKEYNMIDLKIFKLLKISLNLSETQNIIWTKLNNKVCLGIVEDIDIQQSNFDNVIYITSEDFDVIRKIISYQNIQNFSDKYIDPDVKKAIEDTNIMLSKKNKKQKQSFLKQISIVQQSTGLSHAQIMEMSYREFIMAFYTAIDKVEYQCLKTISLLPNVSLSEPIEHWAYEYQHNVTDDVFVDYESFDNKLSI